MLKENFISQAPDEESNAKVTPLDNNKTIIIDQYTSDIEVGNSELFEGAKTMQDVFNHFKPTVDVEFEDEQGGIVSEKLHFNEMRDFEANGGKGNLVANSQFLSVRSRKSMYPPKSASRSNRTAVCVTSSRMPRAKRNSKSC